MAGHLGNREMRRWDAGERECGLGRNVTLFDRLRHAAYCEVRRFKQDGAALADFRARLQSIAASMNVTSGFVLPLDLGEVNGIAKSVSGWTWKNFSVERFSEIQRARINKRWAGHVSLEQGPDSLGDRRQGNGAAPAILTPEALSSLKERLKTPPDDGGPWTGAEGGALARQLP